MTQCTKKEAAQTIANAITELNEKNTLVLLSGGSSASVAVSALALLNKEAQQAITVMLADERFVPYGHADSNGELLKKLDINKYCNEFIETLQSTNPSLQDTKTNFLRQLQHNTDTHQSVIAVFGVGDDNHIAGILPNSPAAMSLELVCAYNTDVFKRITIGPSYFIQIDNAFIYASGEQKQKAVDAIEVLYDEVTHPAQLVKKAKTWQVLFNKENI